MIVVKVGGSLYDLPDLGLRISGWIHQQQGESILIVPGGGVLVDQIRELDRVNQLGEELCHDLALRALSICAILLKRLLPGACIVHDLNTPSFHQPVSILDCWQYFTSSPASHDLPHSWDVTSDSLAAYVARKCQARELILMKSIDWDCNMPWSSAARIGYVDPYFDRLTQDAPWKIRTLNLRTWLNL